VFTGRHFFPIDTVDNLKSSRKVSRLALNTANASHISVFTEEVDIIESIGVTMVSTLSLKLDWLQEDWSKESLYVVEVTTKATLQRANCMGVWDVETPRITTIPTTLHNLTLIGPDLNVVNDIATAPTKVGDILIISKLNAGNVSTCIPCNPMTDLQWSSIVVVPELDALYKVLGPNLDGSNTKCTWDKRELLDIIEALCIRVRVPLDMTE
jgi:hypothetical protein